MSPATRQVNAPRPVTVTTGDDGVPTRVRIDERGSWRSVGSLIERWHIDDRWWSDDPVKRDYFHVEFDNGTALVVFCDAADGVWYAQR